MGNSRKIYLAGKIGPESGDKYVGGGDWREEIVDGLDREHGMSTPLGCDGDEWPIMRNAIFGRFDYVGPFYFECQHGQVLAETHGSHINRVEITRCCLAAIDQCDIFFAWLTSPDAYGTLVELGYAMGRGKSCCLAIPGMVPGADDHELPDWAKEHWFAAHLYGLRPWNGKWGARQSLHDFLRWGSGFYFDSPLEETFYAGIVSRSDFDGFTWYYQHPILGGKYRLDFAFPRQMVAVELDGVTYHGDDHSFQRDRERDRALAQAGWLTVRFTGTDIRADVDACCKQVLDILRQRSSSEVVAV